MVNTLSLEDDILDLVMQLNEAFTWEDRAVEMMRNAADMVTGVRGPHASEDVEDALDTISQRWADLVSAELSIDSYISPFAAPLMGIALEFTQSGLPEEERLRRGAVLRDGGAERIVEAVKEAVAMTPEYAVIALEYAEDILTKKP